MDVSVSELKKSSHEFIDDVIEGLSQKQKTLPCKYFYDETGSVLFEAICDLDEYYITRTELTLLNSIAESLSQMIGDNAVIIEPGAGAGIKIQTLLDQLNQLHTYVPIDISADFLFASAEKIRAKFPHVEIHPIQGDFTAPYYWQGDASLTNRVMFFPGSTIGNFTPKEAKRFLSHQKNFIGPQGAMIIGVDLVKPTHILESAYNDQQGVTADFNKNLLTRINNELGGNFELEQFKHKAIYNKEESRVEMHLISQQEQTVSIGSHQFNFEDKENIHTENSYKYSLSQFAQLADSVGLKSQRVWTDENKLFSIHYLVWA